MDANNARMRLLKFPRGTERVGVAIRLPERGGGRKRQFHYGYERIRLPSGSYHV